MHTHPNKTVHLFHQAWYTVYVVVPFFRCTQKPWNNAIRGMALLVAVQWNLPYLDLYYPVTSIVHAAQISLVTSQGGSTKIAVYLLGGLFILLIITTTLLLGDNTFFTAQGRDHKCTVVTSYYLHFYYSFTTCNS